MAVLCVIIRLSKEGVTNMEDFLVRVLKYPAIANVAAALSNLHIPNELVRCHDGLQLLFPWTEADVIQHSGSYGSKANLMEVMGLLDDNETDDTVAGYLTAIDVMRRIIREYQKVHKDA